MIRTLFLIDGPNAPADCQDGVVAHWSTFAADNAHSIPALVDRSGVELRRDYLAWVHDLGTAPVRGRPLKEFLLLANPDFSAWWLNVVADKAPMASTAIYDTFKLRALEKLYIEHGCTELVYCGDDRRLRRTLEAWCKSLRHRYRWVRVARASSAGRPAHKAIRTLPHLVQGLAFFAWKLCTRFAPTWLRRRSTAKAGAGTHGALIVTFFPNIDLNEARQGRFRSAFWGGLHDVIDELPVTPTWVWIHGNSDQANFRQALSWRDRFNAHPTRKDRHFLLEDFATPPVLVGAIRSYLQLYVRGLALTALPNRFVLPGSTLNFYPLFERQWKSSLFGTTAMRGLLFRALFDSMTRGLPQQRWGLYIWESQPWESALLAAWRRHQNGPIIGHQHATLRPLELRAICDPRTYRETGPAARPLPDVLAINGGGALDLLREVAYPADRLAVVEALRYPRLPRQQHRGDDTPGTLLIVSGYLESEAVMLLRVLDEAAEAIVRAGYSRVRIKTHPFGPPIMHSPNLPSILAYDITAEPLERLWQDTGFAVIANSTSAAVEAVYAGVPIAICAAHDNLNLSPLYGHPAVSFVASGRDLAVAIASPRCALLPADYFLVSESPDRWRDLLIHRPQAVPLTPGPPG